MKKFNKLIALFLIFSIIMLSGQVPASAAVKSARKKVSVTSVTLNKTSMTLTSGGFAETLTATVNPYNATNKDVVWKTSDSNVATVNNGTVTPLSAGTAIITVTTSDSYKTASCTVTVNPVITNVTGISLDKTYMTLTEGGDPGFLTANVVPSDATNKNVIWNTSNSMVATVSNGTVTPVSAGTAIITVTSADGSFTAQSTVTVSPAVIVVQQPTMLTDGTTCTDLGMVKNNSVESTNNFNKLSKAILEGKKILVDGTYFITATSSPTITDKILSISGTTEDSEFKLIGSTNSLFTISNNTEVEISKLKFTNMEGSLKKIFNFQNNALVPKFNVYNNKFYGNIRLVSFYGDMNINPAITRFGIEDFSFTGNTVHNSRYSFIVMENVPTAKVALNDNTINNFDYIFFSNSINNESPYQNEFSDGNKYIEIKNNYVKCDDDWFGNAGSTYYTYYCFVLYEGGTCIYEGNHVEGIKAVTNCAVYDSYLSCQNLTYRNNDLINNLCFYPQKTEAALLKSKGGGGPDRTKNLVRLYENNSYVIDKAYVEKLGQSLDNAWVDLLSFASHAQSYIIRNNTFDVYDLRLMNNANSALNSDSIQIEGNTFKAEKMSGYFLYFKAAVNTDYSQKIHTFINNKVYANELGKYAYLGILTSYDASGGTNNVSRVVVSDNYISSPITAIGHYVYSNTFELKNNTIQMTVDLNKTLKPYNGGKIIDFITTNNNIYCFLIHYTV